MKLGLINSAWAQAGKGTEFGINQTKRIGFDTIDIFADPLDIDANERRLIKEAADRNRLPIKSVACVAVGLIDFNPSVQRFHVDRVKKYLDMCKQFAADNFDCVPKCIRDDLGVNPVIHFRAVPVGGEFVLMPQLAFRIDRDSAFAIHRI